MAEEIKGEFDEVNTTPKMIGQKQLGQDKQPVSAQKPETDGEGFTPMKYRNTLKVYQSLNASSPVPNMNRSSNPSIYVSSATLGGQMSCRSTKSQRDPTKYYLH